MRVPRRSPLLADSSDSLAGRGDRRTNQRVRTRLLGSVSSIVPPAASVTLALGVSLATAAHAQTIVTPVQTTTYTLIPATNPITFGSGTNINVPGGNAVSGGPGTTWNVTVQGAAAGKPAAMISGGFDGITADGALVTNFGTISGAGNGVQVGGGTVLNGGTISGRNSYGVVFNSGGTVTNIKGGTIYGYYGAIRISGAPGTITNAGRLTFGQAAGGQGLYLGSGTLTNLAGGYIQRALVASPNSMVTNAGVIGGLILNGTLINTGTVGGIELPVGTVINQAGGVIEFINATGLLPLGSVGPATVVNAGTITGGLGFGAVNFAGAGPNTLTLQTGSVLNGDAIGSTTAGSTNALILQGNGSANNNFLNFNTLDVQANGLWTLNGTSAVGATTVDSGTLVVGDATHPGAQLISSAGGVLVNAGSLLAGSGTVIGNVNVGGAIAPGAAKPFTTLQVNGNVAFSKGSFFNVNVNPAGQSDKLAVSGTAMLTGGAVQVMAPPTQFPPASQFTILTASSLANTTFAGVTINSLFLVPNLVYTPDSVLLTITNLPFNVVAQTPNEIAVANALNAGPANALTAALFNQTSAAGARQELTALSGEVYAGLQNTMADESQFMRNAMLGRLRQSSYADAPGEIGALGFGGPELAYAKAAVDDGFPTKAPGKPPTASRDYTFWTQGLGGWGHVDGDGNAAALNSRFEGFLSGVDARFGTIRAGFAAGYVHSDLDVDTRSSSAGIDSGQFGLYAGTKSGPLNIRTGASYTFDTIDTGRTVAFPGLFETAHANLSGNVGQVFGEAGYGLTFNHIAAEPFVGLAYVNVHTGAFAENGGIAALSGSSNDENIGYSSLGLRTATIVPLANGTLLVPRLSAQWQYAFGNVTPQAALAFQSTGAAFSVAGVPIARNAALVDTGLDWRITSKMKVGLSYQGELADHAQTHTVKGGFTWNF
jgi:outer membrane autotransporter protein